MADPLAIIGQLGEQIYLRPNRENLAAFKAAVEEAERLWSALLNARKDGEELQEQQEREILDLQARAAELEKECDLRNEESAAANRLIAELKARAAELNIAHQALRLLYAWAEGDNVDYREAQRLAVEAMRLRDARSLEDVAA